MSKIQPTSICLGPHNTVICQSRYVFENLIHVFTYDNPHVFKGLDQILFPDSMDSSRRTTFIYCDESVFPEGLLIATYNDIHYIAAFRLARRQLVWRLQGEVEGKSLDPRDVTSDHKGRVYVADGLNGRILILKALSGEILQVVDLGLNGIVMVSWFEDKGSGSTEHLMLYCLPDKQVKWHISCYALKPS